MDKKKSAIFAVMALLVALAVAIGWTLCKGKSLPGKVGTTKGVAVQTPYISWLYGPMPATPAVLRLDPMWDPLRTDPAFQKLCEEKEK